MKIKKIHTIQAQELIDKENVIYVSCGFKKYDKLTGASYTCHWTDYCKSIEEVSVMEFIEKTKNHTDRDTDYYLELYNDQKDVIGKYYVSTDENLLKDYKDRLLDVFLEEVLNALSHNMVYKQQTIAMIEKNIANEKDDEKYTDLIQVHKILNNIELEK